MKISVNVEMDDNRIAGINEEISDLEIKSAIPLDTLLECVFEKIRYDIINFIRNEPDREFRKGEYLNDE